MTIKCPMIGKNQFIIFHRPSCLPIVHLNDDVAFLLRPESFRVLLFCANQSFCYLNITGITKLKCERKTKRILVVVVKCRLCYIVII